MTFHPKSDTQAQPRAGEHNSVHSGVLQTCCKRHLQGGAQCKDVCWPPGGGRGEIRQIGAGVCGGVQDHGWIGHGGGTSLVNLCQIQTAIPNLVGLPWAARICANYFAGAKLSSSIRVAAATHSVKGINSTYPGLSCGKPQPCTGYRAGHLTCLFQGVNAAHSNLMICQPLLLLPLPGLEEEERDGEKKEVRRSRKQRARESELE